MSLLDPADTIVWDWQPQDTRAAGGPDPRYEVLGNLGQGSIGDVYRVRDRVLNRVVAMKVISAATTPATSLRFKAEAQATAQLAHPSIVPLYDVGQGTDGRLFYTMKLVEGATLRQHIERVHAEGATDLRRLIVCFAQICEAMAYAHARGVVHRDLKPDNVMVGDFGETIVLDWGLSKIVRAGEVFTDRSESATATQHGVIVGTPAYMPPEQAVGQVDDVGPRADVYALGAMLYEMLCGQMPYEGRSAMEVLAQLTAGPPRPVRSRTDLALPPRLVALVEHAMERRPNRRPPDAGWMSEAVDGWLAGQARREEGRQLVAEADTLLARAVLAREEAVGLRSAAETLLAGTDRLSPSSAKEPGWELQDRAAELDRQVTVDELRYVQTLHAALHRDPDLPEAHDRLADLYLARHQAAEDVGDDAHAAELEVLVRAHHRGRYADWLEGDGFVSVAGEGRATLARYRVQGRQLVPTSPERVDLPLQRHRLARGSWLLQFEHVAIPLAPARGQHVDLGTIHVPDDLGPDDLFVAGGPALLGGGRSARRQVDVRPFVIRRFPVTNTEYLAFLDALVDAGREDEALEHVPRERSAASGWDGEMIYGRDADGHFVLQPDADGHVWDPRFPVCMVPWSAAMAYAAWMAETTGLPWRLPREVEWEKAARGADGRIFPWGDFLDPTFCCMGSSHEGRPHPMPIGAFPTDASPYGVRDLSGGMEDWCLDAWEPEPDWEAAREVGTDAEYRVSRGGYWIARPELCRLDRRTRREAHFRVANISFRLARSAEHLLEG